MKKTLITVFVLVLISAVSYGQAQVAIGLKAGANISKFDAEGADNLTSFHGGAFALFKLTKIGIQPEILFSQQGTSTDGGDLKINYFNVPVMVKIYLAAGINLQAGPQFGFLSSAKFDGDDAKDALKSSDISANIGLGWDLPFGLMIDARYNFGLTDVSEGSGFTTEELKSRVIQISVGYKLFKLGK